MENQEQLSPATTSVQETIIAVKKNEKHQQQTLPQKPEASKKKNCFERILEFFKRLFG